MLVGLLLYDVVWVFGSPSFAPGGDNVMLEVSRGGAVQAGRQAGRELLTGKPHIPMSVASTSALLPAPASTFLSGSAPVLCHSLPRQACS
jgi:hypothetical protein